MKTDQEQFSKWKEGLGQKPYDSIYSIFSDRHKIQPFHSITGFIALYSRSIKDIVKIFCLLLTEKKPQSISILALLDAMMGISFVIRNDKEIYK